MLGEHIMYMVPEISGKHKFEPMLEFCIGLGITHASGEYIRGTTDGVLKTSAVTQVAYLSYIWDVDDIRARDVFCWEVLCRREGIHKHSRTMVPEDRRPIIKYSLEEETQPSEESG